MGNWLKNITHFGLDEARDHTTRRNIFLCNWISIILIGIVFIQFFVRNFVFGHISTGIGLDVEFTVAGMVLFSSPVLFNRLGLIHISRLILCYFPVFFIWSLGLQVFDDLENLEASTYHSLRIIILGLGIIPYLLFNRNQPWFLILAIFPALFSILFFDWIMTQWGFGPREAGVWYGEYPLVTMRTTLAYVIISLASFTLQSIILKNDPYTSTLIRKITDSRTKILSRNMKLDRQQKMLNDLNKNLEDLVDQKTKDLVRKNYGLEGK
jgi:hypothetical protein